ncbi:MAG: FAD-dependent oxidoreductase [Pseudobdellovibrionaceae bacterium]
MKSDFLHANSEQLKKISTDVESLEKRHNNFFEYMDWSKRKSVLGSVSFASPGQYVLSKSIKNFRSYKNNFLFAGEHCSCKNSATMEGAVESAIAAVRSFIA